MCGEKKYRFDPVELLSRYRERDFLTTKGEPIKTLEAMCDAYNGSCLEKKRREERIIKCSEEIMSPMQRPEVNVTDMSYSVQLKDNRWKSFRVFVMAVRGHKCELCGENGHLQVHHLHYKKDCLAWEYSVKEVMVLCDSCHARIHNKNKNED